MGKRNLRAGSGLLGALVLALLAPAASADVSIAEDVDGDRYCNVLVSADASFVDGNVDAVAPFVPDYLSQHVHECVHGPPLA